MIAAMILAGGSSARMGRPKALLPFPDLPLVAAQWLALRAGGLDPLRIVVGGADAARVVAGSGLARENFVRNRSRAGTPFSSLQAGLRALLRADRWPAVLVQPVDAWPPRPGVVGALVERLAFAGDAAAVPVHRGRGGHPVLLGRGLALALVGMDPRAGRLDEVLRRLAAAGRLGRVEVRTEDVLWNLNDPAAHRRALRRIRG